MLNRLVQIFLQSTANIKTKRLIESLMNDFIYVVYFIIVFACFGAVVVYDTTAAFVITSLVFIFMLGVWGWFSYKLRKTLLSMLYPPVTKYDENGDADDEMQYFNELTQIMKNLKDDLDKMKTEDM